MNILRLSFLLVLIGFFAPIGCNLNGYQIAQGMLGNTKGLGNATLLAPVGHFYGYVLFGVFLFAFVGLLFTFLAKIHNNFLIPWDLDIWQVSWDSF
jgi:ABC-type nitrate/sulfonate/bicarbonate transport system permease component